MADVKVTFGFRCGDYGWSESWYQSNGSVSSGFDALEKLAKRWMDIRVNCLAKGVSITTVRYAAIDGSRQAFVLPYSYLGTGGGMAAADANVNVPSDAVLVKLYRVLNSKPINLYLRGVPDGWITATSFGDPSNDPVVKGFVGAFTKRLSDDGWSIRNLVQPPGVGVVRTPITALAVDVATGFVKVTATGANFAQGAIVQVQRMGPPDLNRLNGQWKVIRVDADNFLLPIKPQLVPVTAYNGKGSVFPTVYVLNALQNTYSIRGNTTRNTGRPLYLHRGRRKARR